MKNRKEPANKKVGRFFYSWREREKSKKLPFAEKG